MKGYRQHNPLAVKVFLLFSDFAFLLFGFLSAYLIRVRFDERPLLYGIQGEDYLITAITGIPIVLVIFAILGLYKKSVYNNRVKEAFLLFVGTFIGTMFLISADYFTATPLFPARLIPIYIFVISFIVMVVVRNIIHTIRNFLFRYRIGTSNTIVFANSHNQENLRELLLTNDPEYNIVAVAIDGKKHIDIPKNIAYYDSHEQLLSAVKDKSIDSAIYLGLPEDAERHRSIVDAVRNRHIDFYIYPKVVTAFEMQHTTEIIAKLPMLHITQTPLSGSALIVKRIMDIVLACIALILLSPLFLIVALLIKINDPEGPVFFKHNRVTRYGKKFPIYKFRSMTQRYSGKDPIKVFKEMGRNDLIQEFEENQKVDDDPRVSKLGTFLRASSLDELPQIWNVIRGDLSLIGPRPIVDAELKHYKDTSSLLLSVKPGMTGLWQVSGRSELTYEERVKLELYYANNWSLALDFKILLRTIGAVLRKVGAK